MTQTQKYLEKLGACEAGMAWVGKKPLKKAWGTCRRADWMQWLLVELLEAEYNNKIKPIWDEYDRGEELLRIKYVDRKTPNLAAYLKREAPLREKRDTQTRPFWSKFYLMLDNLRACTSCKQIRAKFKCPNLPRKDA